MFFVTEALLLTENITASTHKGVITLFGKHFIKEDKIDRELGKLLRRAFDLRQKGDYASMSLISRKEAVEILEKAEEFVSVIETRIDLEKIQKKL